MNLENYKIFRIIPFPTEMYLIAQTKFQVCTKKKQLPAPDTRTAASFLKCLAVQMTLYVQQLTLSSMADFDKFVLSLDAVNVTHQPAGE